MFDESATLTATTSCSLSMSALCNRYKEIKRLGGKQVVTVITAAKRD